MRPIRTHFVAMSACAASMCVLTLAEAQDLSRYRDDAFGSSVASVIATALFFKETRQILVICDTRR
jgi:hypothetical protein